MPLRERDLAAENEALREENVALRHEVEVLLAKVVDLEARLSQGSCDSSAPPSQDSLKSQAERRSHTPLAFPPPLRVAGLAEEPGRTTSSPTLGRHGDVRCGEALADKQPGALGRTLMARSDPDKIVVHNALSDKLCYVSGLRGRSKNGVGAASGESDDAQLGKCSLLTPRMMVPEGGQVAAAPGTSSPVWSIDTSRKSR